MGLLSVTMFVRLVGYEQYGRYAVALSLTTTISAWAAGWLNPGILRFKSSCSTSESAGQFRDAVRLGTIASVAAGMIGVSVAFKGFVGGPWDLTVLVAALVASGVVYAILLAAFQAGMMSTAVV